MSAAEHLVAPVPYDIYANSKPAVEACQDRSHKGELVCLNAYAREVIDLGEIIDFCGADPVSLIHRDWQIHSSALYKFTKDIPVTTHPIVAYRVYTSGIIESGRKIQLQKGTHDFGNRLRSVTLSQTYMNAFASSYPDQDQVHTRVDILNGIELVPLFKYGTIDTEYELVLNMGRLHVFPGETVLEGREYMPAIKPIEDVTLYSLLFNDSIVPRVTFTTCKVIDYYFIISEPGTMIEYNPDYKNYSNPDTFPDKFPYNPTRGGGRLQLSDDNALGIGNVIEMMDEYIRKQQIVNEPIVNEPIAKKRKFEFEEPFHRFPSPSFRMRSIKTTRMGGKRKRTYRKRKKIRV